MPAILFVCEANLFRSPLAVACLRQIVTRDYPDEVWRIGSAGVWAQDGLPVSPITLQVAQRLGLTGLKSHVTRQVTATLLEKADIVLTMEAGQKEALRFEFPFAARAIFQLSEVADHVEYDIADPTDPGVNPEEVGQALCLLIQRGSAAILALARQLSAEKNPPR